MGIGSQDPWNQQRRIRGELDPNFGSWDTQSNRGLYSGQANPRQPQQNTPSFGPGETSLESPMDTGFAGMQRGQTTPRIPGGFNVQSGGFSGSGKTGWGIGASGYQPPQQNPAMDPEFIKKLMALLGIDYGQQGGG